MQRPHSEPFSFARPCPRCVHPPSIFGPFTGPQAAVYPAHDQHPFYVDSPLDSSRARTRLVRLLPGAYNDELREETFTVELDASPPEYEPISYTWGSYKRNKPIVLDRVAGFKITENLDAALRRIRLTDKARTLWVDIFSINQDHHAEKTQQVLLQHKIYTHGKRTLIWLGKDGEGEVGSVSPEMALYNVYCHNPSRWWRRKWICQEYALASQVQVYLSKYTMTWGSFKQLLWRVLEWKQRFLPFEDVKQLESLEELRRRVQSGGKLSMPELLYLTRAAMATDPRDEIYAILALADDGLASHLSPDYTMPVEAVFAELARRLQIMHETTHRMLLDPNAVPSRRCWDSVADRQGHTEVLSLLEPLHLSSTFDGGPIKPVVHVRSCLGEAVEEQSPILDRTFCWSVTSIDLNKRKPALRGFILDKVHMSLGRVHKTDMAYRASEWIIEALLHCDSEVVTGPGGILAHRTIGPPWLLDPYHRLLMTHGGQAGVGSGVAQQSNLPPTSESQKIEANNLANCRLYSSEPIELQWEETVEETLQYWSSCLEVNAPRFTRSWRQERHMFRWQDKSYCDDCLFVTVDGFAGIGSCGIETNDIVVILCGSTVPYILREKGDAYVLIGTAYVHGIMCGELHEQCPDLKLPMQDFIIL